MSDQKPILWLCCALAMGCCLRTPRDATAQSSISSTTLRPFVVGFVPVIGRNGTVGGISIDAAGVVTRAKIDTAKLSATRRSVLGKNAKTKLRMISLTGLEQAIAERFSAGKPITEEMLFVAGLQRAEFVFAVPDQRDIVLAGPAENWRIDQRGVAVGVTSGQPTLRLDDLLEAFRTAEIAANGRGISCSIDPSEEGIERLQRLLRTRNLQFNARTAALMKKAVGPQRITVTGVLPDSHFARVMVAADYLMKRLAMDLEGPTVAEMPSYMDLLKADGISSARTASPRWWMSVNYSRLLRSEDGLSWQLRGPGVKVMTEDAFVDSTGAIVESGKTDRHAQRWAETMTDKYAELSIAMPVFGELRNCMDLAVVAALLTHYDLVKHVGAELPSLTGERSNSRPCVSRADRRRFPHQRRACSQSVDRRSLWWSRSRFVVRVERSRNRDCRADSTTKGEECMVVGLGVISSKHSRCRASRPRCYSTRLAFCRTPF